MTALRIENLPQLRTLSFTIPGRIGGKGRHRAFIRKGKIATFTPAKTVSDEAVVRQFAALAMAGGMPMLIGALQLDVVVTRIPPISWPAKRRATACFVTGKPDCDNVLKLIGDALNGIAYQDDSQIALLSMSRFYRTYGIEETRVVIIELGGL